MTYKDILQSDYFFDTYSQIEFLKKDFPVNHGFVHVWHVVKWAKTLSQFFHLTDEETELLLIASVLHDIGYLNGREEHAKSGAIDAKAFLQGKTSKNIERICSAIANHGGEDAECFKDNVSMCLVLADKFDFDKTRYRHDDNHKSVNLFLTIEKTELVSVDGKNYFKIHTTNPEIFTDLQNNHFFKKLNRVLDNLFVSRNIKIEIKFEKV